MLRTDKQNIILQKLINSFWLINTLAWGSIWISKMYLVFPSQLNDNIFQLDLFIGHLLGFLSSVALRYIYHRVKYKKMSIIKLGLITLFLSFVFANIWYIIHLIVQTSLRGYSIQFNAILYTTIGYYVIYNTLILLAWSFIYFAIKIKRDFDNERERNRQNELLAQKAELQLLRYQINPHFLFNSLNSIRALTLLDVNAAREMISELSEFFKYSVLNKNNMETSLSKEISALEHYLKIEKIRLKEKLEVIYDINDNVKDFPIPVMLIHPIVENAIKYGMQTTELPLKITIKAFLDNDMFILEIRNSGRWIKEHERKSYNISGTSTGLRNVQERLANTYQNNHTFEINKNDSFVAVLICIKGIEEKIYE